MSIFYISAIKPSKATDTVKEVYDQLKTEMGDVVEPISLHALLPDLLLGIWGILRETVVVEDHVKRSVKEAVGAAVSSVNDCPYCVDAHTIMILGLKDKVVANAIVKKDPNLITDDSVKEIVRWSFSSKDFDSSLVLDPPFSREMAPEIIGTAVFFHYLNRMVTIFLGPTILPMNVSFLKGVMKSMAAKMFSGVLSEDKKPGEIMNGMANSPDFFWAISNARVAYTFSYFQKTLESTAEKNIPVEVRNFLCDQIEEWNGADLELNDQKLASLTAHFSKENRLLASMLYLTAFSPHKIRHYHFEEFKATNIGDDAFILSALAWASFSTATRIGKQLGRTFK